MLCFYRNVIQRFDFRKFYGRNSISTFTIDRTMIDTVRKYLWICITVDSGMENSAWNLQFKRESFCSGKFYSITCLGIKRFGVY